MTDLKFDHWEIGSMCTVFAKQYKCKENWHLVWLGISTKAVFIDIVY